MCQKRLLGFKIFFDEKFQQNLFTVCPLDTRERTDGWRGKQAQHP